MHCRFICIGFVTVFLCEYYFARHDIWSYTMPNVFCCDAYSYWIMKEGQYSDICVMWMHPFQRIKLQYFYFDYMCPIYSVWKLKLYIAKSWAMHSSFTMPLIPKYMICEIWLHAEYKFAESHFITKVHCTINKVLII